MTAKQTLKQRKALRSAAAKKGWETRIARERREIEAARAASERSYALALETLHREREKTADYINSFGVADWVSAEPKPTLWQRIKGWFA